MNMNMLERSLVSSSLGTSGDPAGAAGEQGEDGIRSSHITLK